MQNKEGGWQAARRIIKVQDDAKCFIILEDARLVLLFISLERNASTALKNLYNDIVAIYTNNKLVNYKKLIISFIKHTMRQKAPLAARRS